MKRLTESAIEQFAIEQHERLDRQLVVKLIENSKIIQINPKNARIYGVF